VIADPTVSGQQSFIIDRGDRCITLEAAKALLAAQVAVSRPCRRAYDDEEPFDIEVEIGSGNRRDRRLSDDPSVGEESSGETDAEGHKRKRRRRRRAVRARAREGGPCATRSELPRVASDTVAVAGAIGR